MFITNYIHDAPTLPSSPPQGHDVIPIPGATSLSHLEENLAARHITMTAEDLAEVLLEVDKVFGRDKVAGTCYGEQGW